MIDFICEFLLWAIIFSPAIYRWVKLVKSIEEYNKTIRRLK